MGCYVLKFGGTSVANITRMRHVAGIVKGYIDEGHRVVVVVSAMDGITNELVEYSQALCPNYVSPEHDVVLSSGEQVTSGLMAMALNALGFEARSYLAWQIPIKTDDTPSRSRILDICTKELDRCLEQGVVPVVAGFQGVTESGRLTTLGRGGSDTTAVALAAALGADRCDIYTDVNGVYSADPRFVDDAIKLKQITYEEMFEMAAHGAKVLQARSVELAMKHKVKLRVLSSFIECQGTDVVPFEEKEEGVVEVEKTTVSGITHSQNDVVVTVRGIPIDACGIAKIFSCFADEMVQVDMLNQSSVYEAQATDLSFTVAKADLDKVQRILKSIQETVNFKHVDVDANILKLSVIGIGIKSDLKTFNLLFNTLSDIGAKPKLMTTSEIRLSVVVDNREPDKTLNSLHQAYFSNKEAA